MRFRGRKSRLWVVDCSVVLWCAHVDVVFEWFED